MPFADIVISGTKVALAPFVLTPGALHALSGGERRAESARRKFHSAKFRDHAERWPHALVTDGNRDAVYNASTRDNLMKKTYD
jgi:hypothetical protein